MSTIKQNFHAECESAINKQINSELASSYFYMALAYHFDRDDVALENFHKYFCKFSNNKRENAQKLLKYMNERGGRVKLADIGTPANNFGEPLNIMQAVLEHERKVRIGRWSHILMTPKCYCGRYFNKLLVGRYN